MLFNWVCLLGLFGSIIPGLALVQNVALYGKATQSSIVRQPYTGLGDASNAIDGNRGSHVFHGSCTHTALESNPWWRVDLLNTYRVYQVVITNRGDCCGERLNGAEIRIGNSLDNNGNSNPRCAKISSIPGGQTRSFYCRGMEGRWVNVVIPGERTFLTLCEVEVHGYPAQQ